MPLNLAAANDILKDDYLPDIIDVLNNNTVLLQNIESNSTDFQGKRAYLPLKVGRNQGTGSRPESGQLPSPGNQQYDSAYWDMTHHYQTIKVTGQAIAAMKNDDGSWTRAIDSEVQGAVKDALDDFNRQLFGDATGILADPGNALNGTSFTVDTSRYLQVGMLIDFIEINTGLPLSGGQNVAIATIPSSLTFTTSTSVVGATTSNTRIVRHGNYGNEIFGLKAAVSSANPPQIAGVDNLFGEITRTGNPFWQANEIGSATHGGILTLDLIQTGIDASDLNAGGTIDFMITTHFLHRRYAQLNMQDRRFPTADGKPISYDGGYKALMYDDIEVFKDKHCPEGYWFMLEKGTFHLFTGAEWDWMDKDGSILYRPGREDSYEATLFAYKQLGCENPARNTVLTGLTQ